MSLTFFSRLPLPSGSSTDVSEDWEKDFDLDMTEEEVQMALSKIETSGEVRVETVVGRMMMP